MMGNNKNKPKTLSDQIKKNVQICLHTKTCTCMIYMKPYFLNPKFSTTEQEFEEGEESVRLSAQRGSDSQCRNC